MTDRTGGINRFGGGGGIQTPDLGQGSQREPGPEGQRDTDQSRVPIPVRKPVLGLLSLDSGDCSPHAITLLSPP